MENWWRFVLEPTSSFSCQHRTPTLQYLEILRENKLVAYLRHSEKHHLRQRRQRCALEKNYQNSLVEIDQLNITCENDNLGDFALNVYYRWFCFPEPSQLLSVKSELLAIAKDTSARAMMFAPLHIICLFSIVLFLRFFYPFKLYVHDFFSTIQTNTQSVTKLTKLIS